MYLAESVSRWPRPSRGRRLGRPIPLSPRSPPELGVRAEFRKVNDKMMATHICRMAQHPPASDGYAASRRPGQSVQPLSERRNVAAAIFSFSFHHLAKQISAKKLSHPAEIHPGRERLMIPSRLPVLGAIALIVVMILNCGVAVAGPNQTSADYVMPGCRDAASLISFSNAGDSEEQASLMGFCAGIVVGLSFMGQP